MDLIKDLRELALGSHMKRVLERTNKGVSGIYRELGLDFEARWFTLLYLLNRKSPMTITGIAECLGFTHPAVNKLAAEMIRAGLLSSRTGKRDRRQRLLSITGKGRETAALLEPVWEEIRLVTRELLEASDHNLLLALEDLERLLDEKEVYDRVFERLRPRLLEEIEIVDYRPAYKKQFRDLNYRWLKQRFRVEKHDKDVLNDPVGMIIKPGGAVIFARVGGRIVGTCALIRHDGDVYELSKMAVAERARGRSVGTALTLAVIDRARALGARELYLETHPTLVAAQRLYESLGFKRVRSSPIPRHYRRKRVCMKFDLKKEGK
jgi:ribosomal protein S18 acetylase RimI-like enzyme